jgi:L-ascorbate metabolism protein UlaG (beta-lactamase superfamily)
MRIQKFIHSCLLVESRGVRVLMDPGKFTFLGDAVKAESFRDLDAIVVTHAHVDHLDPDALATIVAHNPAAVVFSNEQIRDQLARVNIAVEVLEGGKRSVRGCSIEAIPAEHARLLNAEIPRNVAYVIDGKLLHPGDSFDASLEVRKGIELLALPVMAPWTTELGVADFAMRLAPKRAFPIHDGYAKDFFVQSRHDNYGNYFSKQGIEFVQLREVGAEMEMVDR